jgi:hypothetical protein
MKPEIGCPAGHPGADGPEDYGCAGAAARVRGRAAYRADQRSSARSEPGHPLSRAAEVGAGRRDFVRVGATEAPLRVVLYFDYRRFDSRR